jgi:hypothetical protein
MPDRAGLEGSKMLDVRGMRRIMLLLVVLGALVVAPSAAHAADEEPQLLITTPNRTAVDGEAVPFRAELLDTGTIALTAGSVTLTATHLNGSNAPSLANVATTRGTCSATTPVVTCSLPDIQPGERVVFTGTATFTGAAAEFDSVNAEYATSATTTNASNLSSVMQVQLNDPTLADLDVAVTAPTQVVVGATAQLVVTVTNHGAAAAATMLTGRLRAAGAAFGTEPATCISGTGTSTCLLGTIAAGASVIVTLPVTTLATGTVAASFDVISSTNEAITDNNVTGASFTVVEPPATVIPVIPVTTVVAPVAFTPTFARLVALKIPAAVKSGIAVTVTADRAAAAVTRLYVSHATAVRLKLVKPAAKGNVLVGTKTVASKVAGKLVVRTTFAAEARAAVAKSKAKLALIVTTVVTPTGSTVGVTHTQTVALSPAPTKRHGPIR